MQNTDMHNVLLLFVMSKNKLIIQRRWEIFQYTDSRNYTILK